MPRKTAEPIPTLADLIRAHQDATGDSYGDIARKTAGQRDDEGNPQPGLSKAKIGQLARPENNYLVRQETIKKLAHGLGLPVATVQRASLGTAGFNDPDAQRTDRVRRIAERLGELDSRQLDLVAGLIEVVAKDQPRRRPTVRQ
jgi:hypothetical protein